MGLAAAGVIATAGLLGLSHAVEPDHVAGITSVARGADRIRRSAAVGVSFAAGHALLVVGWVALWYATGGRLAGTTALAGLGTYLVAALLSLLAVAAIVRGLSRLVHRHEHAHGGATHAHYHLHVGRLRLGRFRRWLDRLPPGPRSRPLRAPAGTPSGAVQPTGDAERDHPGHGAGTPHEHAHGLRSYLRIGLLGALFTLSPPLSMLAFLAVVLPRSTGALVGVAIAAYAAALVVGMGLVGAGAGWALDLAARLDGRLHASLQVVVGAAILGFAVRLVVGL